MTKPYNYSIKLLSKRDYSIYKLRKKLVSKGYDKFDIDNSIELLLEKRFLRPKEHRDSLIQTYFIRSYSFNFIEQKLQQEEINVSKQELAELAEQQDLCEEKILQSIIDKKYPDLRRINDLELKSKAYTFLCAKGFPEDMIQDQIGSFY